MSPVVVMVIALPLVVIAVTLAVELNESAS
jgi:hypothetical protein